MSENSFSFSIINMRQKLHNYVNPQARFSHDKCQKIEYYCKNVFGTDRIRSHITEDVHTSKKPKLEQISPCNDVYSIFWIYSEIGFPLENVCNSETFLQNI